MLSTRLAWALGYHHWKSMRWNSKLHNLTGTRGHKQAWGLHLHQSEAGALCWWLSAEVTWSLCWGQHSIKATLISLTAWFKSWSRGTVNLLAFLETGITVFILGAVQIKAANIHKVLILHSTLIYWSSTLFYQLFQGTADTWANKTKPLVFCEAYTLSFYHHCHKLQALGNSWGPQTARHHSKAC